MKPSLHVCTVASHESTCLQQLLDSCVRQGITLDVLGMGQPFEGWAHKFIYVRKYLEELPDTDVVLFVDAYDALILAPPERILKTFLDMKTSFVVSAEKYLYPYPERKLEFPQGPTSFKYINSGVYIGYVGYIKQLFKKLSPFKEKDDDQGLLILHYLKHPKELALDRHCELFLNTYGLEADDLIIDTQKRSIRCVETGTTPCVVHGQRHSIWYQYIYDLFFPKSEQESKTNSVYDKTVLLAILTKDNEDLLPKYLKAIETLDYNKQLITLYVNVYESRDRTKEILKAWCKEHEKQYREIIFDTQEVGYRLPVDAFVWVPQKLKIPGFIRKKSLQKAQELGVDYYFVVDCDNFIAPTTLKKLMSKNKPIIAPMLRIFPESKGICSNYCNDVIAIGRSYSQYHADYLRIYNHVLVGTFTVPELFGTYLVQSKYFDALTYQDETYDYPYLVFSRSARKHGVTQYVCNEEDFGKMIQFFDFLAPKQIAILKEFIIS